ncbi:MAG: phenylalanine--tRNA ligase subunit alpha [Candidatus Omnitrophica bacterium]|nr:phenylalanine--tRNA ligase subunit alpha [Candidatus Omnitrophota bacterium]
MEEKIKQIKEQALNEIDRAETGQVIEELRVRYLGRKSEISQLFSQIPKMDSADKGKYGKELNILKQTIATALDEKTGTFGAKEEKIDLTLPAASFQKGTKHVLSHTTEAICRIFEDLGFIVYEGTEIENEWHNFSALNIPLEHPSRDAFDTFYLDVPEKREGKYLLRSHTSPSQIHVMKKLKPPLAVISPGRVYRPDKVDASHSFMFHQVEGFCVDTDINFAHLKGVLLHFARRYYSPDVKLRFRPHFFPFTEPSAEVDVSCMICHQKGCSVCSQKGWIEILGCGMIHPNVLGACHIDPKKYQGFAFGMGVDRIAMQKYGINDIRLFYENDKRFLDQFDEV